VMAGYGTLFDELQRQIGRAPDFLFVQAGVGGLSAAGVSAVRHVSTATKIVIVEPEGSAGIARSLAAGSPTAVEDVPTVMACLRCQSVSAVAWPALVAGVDAVVLVTDDHAATAVRALAHAGVVAGASGAAGLAGLLVACADPAVRTELGMTSDSTLAVVNTEGATDPESYQAILARER
jgi:diaminopropionate ammonia-lyase